ncbi:hypothetical protein [Nonomuraea jabiensis]|uniref:hypothetical protein n=1 Tax=Nonomuraea jabiensis TaxID=882448 RepID=UPI003D752CE8
MDRPLLHCEVAAPYGPFLKGNGGRVTDETMVRWEGTGPSGCLLALGVLPFGVLLTFALNLFSSVPWFPHGLNALGSMLALGVVPWPVNERYEVTVAEFIRHQIRLVSRAAVRTVEAADSIGAIVAHSASINECYTRTSPQVAWYGGKEIVDGFHAATLAPSLRRLLPPGVRHVWEELEYLL